VICLEYDSEFIRELFGTGNRVLSYKGDKKFARQLFTDVNEFTYYYNQLVELHLDAFVSVQPMIDNDYVKGIEKIFFDFDLPDFYDVYTMHKVVDRFKEVLLEFGAEPLIFFSGSKGYHLLVYLPKQFHDFVIPNNSYHKFTKRFYQNLQMMIINKADIPCCRMCGSFNIVIGETPKDSYCAKCGIGMEEVDKGKRGRVGRLWINRYGPDPNVIGDIKRIHRLPFSYNSKGMRVIPVDSNEELSYYKKHSLDYDICKEAFKKALDGFIIKRYTKKGWKNDKYFRFRRNKNVQFSVRPCFNAILDSKHPPQHARVALVLELYYSGFSSTEIKEVFKRFEDYDERITEYQVNYILSKARELEVKPYKCATLKEYDICDMSCI